MTVWTVNGRASAWFPGVQARYQGHIRAGGFEKDVTFVEEPAAELNNRIDAVYRVKYLRYAKSIVSSIVSTEARSATIKIMPHVASSTGEENGTDPIP